MFCEVHDHRFEIQAPIGDMHGNDAVGFHVSLVNHERFPRQQMDRDRVAVERIERKQIEILRRLAFQREPRVAESDLRLRRTIGQEGEPDVRQSLHFGIDFVNVNVISRPRVGRQRADA